MIKSMTATNYLGQSIKMELGNSDSSGFLILNIDGLGPGKANINVTNLALEDGAKYNSAVLPSRNIVAVLMFRGNNVEEKRHESYKYFPIKQKVKLAIDTDKRHGEIEGYVESNEPVIFSKQTGTQISILCPYPYFDSGKNTVTTFYGVEPAFEFPFSNESLTEPLIEFGRIYTKTTGAIKYEGDAMVGITIVLEAFGPVGDVTIHNVNTRESMTISSDRLAQITGEGIVNGDKITITTTKGIKAINLLRRGIYINILNVLNRPADWFQLSKGDNVFAFVAENGLENLMFYIENRTIYEGV